MNILIIEDDAAIRQELKLLLENALYQVTVLTKFHHVVEDILQMEPDLILLDVNLPQQSGFEICKSVRKTSDVPIIFLRSGFESDEITDKAIEFSKNLELKSVVYNLEDYADINPLLSPLIFVVPLEWFVYYLAHFNGEDPGATRHIGKVRY